MWLYFLWHFCIPTQNVENVITFLGKKMIVTLWHRYFSFIYCFEGGITYRNSENKFSSELISANTSLIMYVSFIFLLLLYMDFNIEWGLNFLHNVKASPIKNAAMVCINQVRVGNRIMVLPEKSNKNEKIVVFVELILFLLPISLNFCTTWL